MSRDGEVDWLCWPRFGSPSLFASLAGPGGTWRIAPSAPASSTQGYLDDTNVVWTRFTHGGGVLCVTDFLPVEGEQERRHHLAPQHELVRQVSCEQGEVDVDVHFAPRPDDGRQRPVLRKLGALGLRLECQRHLYCLRGLARYGPHPRGGVGARFTLRRSQGLASSLTASSEGPAVLPLEDEAPVRERLARTLSWWRTWAGRARYEGPHRAEVVRQLEPPGFLGLHYGARTPLAVLLSHLCFGAILGAFYQG